MPPRRRIDDCDVIDGRRRGDGERQGGARHNRAAKEKRMEDKTVFSVETIGEIATTKTSSAEDVASWRR